MMRDQDLEKLARSSRRAAVITGLGVSMVVASLLYSSAKLSSAENEVQQKRQEVAALNEQLRQQSIRVEDLGQKVNRLKGTQENLLDFLANVTDESQIKIFDGDIDWDTVKTDLHALPDGKRKQTILTAILLAWKEIPFALGNQSVDKGFDSPRFIQYVLSKNGVSITPKPGERMSDALMRSFKKVEKPLPGDLVFYRGQVGSFGFFYVGDGEPGRAGIGIGTLQASAPLQVTSLDRINTPYFPLVGYFRVQYPDETPGQAPGRPLPSTKQ